MKRLKNFGLLGMALGLGLFLAFALRSQISAQASYASQFAKESRLARGEVFDSRTFNDYKVSAFKSVYMTQNATRKVRHGGLLFYAKPQSGTAFNGYAKHWVNFRSLKSGKIYLFTDKTLYGKYLVNYQVMARGTSRQVKVGKTPVKVTFSKNRHVTFKYPKHLLRVQLNNGAVTLDGKAVKTTHGRHFKSAVPTTGSAASRLVKDAKRYLGVPYRYVGRDPFGGLDCASFVNLVYLDVLHKDIGGMTSVQQRLGRHISPKKAKKGDLLFWVSPGQVESYHVAMAIGNGKLIEEAGRSVHISSIRARKPQYAIAMHNAGK